MKELCRGAISWFLGVSLLGGCLAPVNEVFSSPIANWISPQGSTLLLNQPTRLEVEGAELIDFRVRSGPAVIDGSLITVTNLGPVEVIARKLGDMPEDRIVASRLFNPGGTQFQVVGEYGLGRFFKSFEVSDGFVYSLTLGDLEIIDVREPRQPHREFVLDRIFGDSIQVCGDFAYVTKGNENALRVVDISNPTSARIVGQLGIDGFFPESLHASNPFVFLWKWDEVITVDVSDAFNPSLVGRLTTSSGIRGVHMVSHTMVVEHILETEVFDFSDPANPRLIGVYGDVNQGRPRVSEGDYRYAEYTEGVRVLDLNDLGNPILVASFTPQRNLHELYVRGDWLLTSDVGGLSVLDVSDPELLVPVARVDQFRNPENLRVDGDLIFLESPDKTLQILQRTLPVSPQRLPQSLAWRLPKSISITRSSVPLEAKSQSGLPLTYSVIRGPAQIVGGRLEMTGFGSVAVRCEQAGNEQFLPASKVWEFEVTGDRGQTVSWISPAHDELLLLNQPYRLQAEATSGLSPITFEVKSGPASIEGGWVTVTNLGAVVLSARQSGNRVYEAAVTQERFNVGGNFSLSLIAEYGVGESIHDIDVHGGLAFLAKGSGGLEILDVTDPVKPASVAEYDMDGAVLDVAVRGETVYLANSEVGLEILSIANPARPQFLGRAEVPCEKVELSGDTAFLVEIPRESSFGMTTQFGTILDVSNPSDPELLTIFDYSVRNLAIDHDNLFIGAERTIENFRGIVENVFLFHYDIRNPGAPSRILQPRGRGPIQASSDAEHHYLHHARSIGFVDWRSWRYYDHGHCMVWFPYGPLGDLLAVDGLLYVADSWGVEILDVTTQPFRSVGSIRSAGRNQHVDVDQHHAYVGESRGRLRVYDVWNPAEPVLLDEFRPSAFLHSVEAVDGTLYLGYEGAGLELYRNIPERLAQELEWSVPRALPLSASPVVLAAESVLGVPWNYEVVSGPGRVEGDQFHFSESGPIILRASNKGENEQFRPTGWTRRILVTEEQEEPAPVLTWVSPTPDSTVPRNQPIPLEVRTNRDLPVVFELEGERGKIVGESLTVTGVGPMVLVAKQEGSFGREGIESRIVINSGIPEGVELVGQIDLPNVNEITVVGDRAYLTNGSLHIFDVSDPARPVAFGSLRHSAFQNGVNVIGDFAYAAFGEALAIADVSDPEKPILVGEYRSSEFSFTDAAVVDGIAYLSANHLPGLEVVDISSPTDPRLLWRYTIDEIPDQGLDVFSVQVENGRAYVRTSRELDNLEIIDVRDMTQPVSMGRFEGGRRTKVVSDDVYVVRDVDVREFGFFENLGLDPFFWGPNGTRDLLVTDYRDPASPRRRGSHRLLSCSPDIVPAVSDIELTATEAFVINTDWSNGNVVHVFGAERSNLLRHLESFQLEWPLGGERTRGLTIVDYEVHADMIYLKRKGEDIVWIFRMLYPRKTQLVPGVFPELFAVDESPVTLASVSNRGLPMTYSVESGPAWVDGSQLNLTGPGVVVLVMEQAGDNQFLPLSERWALTVSTPPIELSIVGTLDGQVQISAPTIDGVHYSLQFRENITSEGWSTLETFLGTGKPWTRMADPRLTQELYFRLQGHEAPPERHQP